MGQSGDDMCSQATIGQQSVDQKLSADQTGSSFLLSPNVWLILGAPDACEVG